MQEQKLQARDKTVKKMSRDGLVEENLQSQDSVRISQREQDSLTLPGQAVDSFELQKGKAYARERAVGEHFSDTQNSSKAKQRRIQLGQRRQLYGVSKREHSTGVTENKLSGLSVQSPPENESENRTLLGQDSSAAGEQDFSDIESARGMSEHSSRMGSIRGHPSNGKKYAETAWDTIKSRKKKIVKSHFIKEN